MRRTRRDYRIATLMVATIGFVVALLLWSARPGGDSSPGDTALLPADDQSAFTLTSFGEPTQSTTPATTPKPGPSEGSALDIPPAIAGGSQALPDLATNFSNVTLELPPPAASAWKADDPSLESITHQSGPFWNTSSPLAGQTARSGRPAGPVAGGGSSPGGAPSSAGAQRASTADQDLLAEPLSVSRQGLTDSAPELGPRASAARTDHHAPVFGPSSPLANLSGPPVFSSSPLANLSGDVWSPSSHASSVAFETLGATSSGSTASILADSAPVSVPEPTSFVLFGAGLTLLARRLKRRERGAA